MSKYRLGIDVGGTFTDAVLVDNETGATRRGKVPSTPDDQSKGVLAAIAQFEIAPDEIAVFTHGHTVAINALLQRNGAHTGLLCTEGTRDLLDMARLRRPFGDDLYDATWRRPHQARPLVHRRHIREVRGRTLHDGSVHVPLDEEAVRNEARFLRAEGINSVAVCLLHSYVNAEHEERVVEILREYLPDAYIESSTVRPVVGEYDRTCSVVLNAYTGPVITRYLEHLRSALRDEGHGHDVLVMQMNGGVRTLDQTVASFPAYTIQSGPVAGLLGAEAYARDFDTPNLICMDVGGTSTDIGVVADGIAQRTEDWEVEFGIRLGFPAIDVRSIGAGGGSIIQIDEHGTLRIGPESAGAVPGPACYRRGGTQPTVTDALVATGVIQPHLFIAGGLKLSQEAARAALATVADPLAIAPEELATGVLELINGHIESEISKVVFERALDISTFSLLAYGGAGPVHGAYVARNLGLTSAIVPYFPGGFSALGMVSAPKRVEHARSVVGPIDTIGPERLNSLFEQLEQRVRTELAEQGVEADEVALERRLAGMYSGQSFANTVPLGHWPSTPETIEQWKSDFHDFFDRVYGYSARETAIVITTLTITGSGPVGHLPRTMIDAGTPEPPTEALIATEPVYLDSEWRPVPFFARQALKAGNQIQGPAVIDDGLATVLVIADSKATVDAYGNLHLDVR